MSSYSKITFNGNFNLLSNSLVAKIPEIKLVQINDNTAIAIVDELESIHYLKGQELQQNVSLISCEDGDYESFKSYLETANRSNASQKETQKEIKSNVARLEDPTTNLNNALINTTLKSKSPLQPEDPFNYILSNGYLLSTSIAISALMLLSNLF